MIDTAFPGWPTILGALADGQDLTTDDAHAALGEVLAGNATSAQIAAFIVALRQKGETVEELTGLVRAMLDAAEPLEVPTGTIDIVGAGGAPARRSHALNVSTMACFVAAGAGAVVCKHGNRRASSTSGAFDLLEELGVGFEHTPEQLGASVASQGLGFAFARTFHPAMRHAAPVRAELGIPTVFNILGPLSHPGRVSRQVIGSSDPDTADLMIRVLAANGSVRSMVVTGDAGLDEIALTGPSRVLELADGQISETTIAPEDLGLARCSADDLVGGDPATNAGIAQDIFAGVEVGPCRDIVVLNAAAGLVVAGLAGDMSAGVDQAQASIVDGKALAVLDRLRQSEI